MKKWLTILVVVLTISSIALFLLLNGEKNTRTIKYQDHQLEVIVVKSVLDKAKGLSNIELADFEADGMLFVFSDYQVRSFWMRGMRFDLEVLWIKDNKILQIDRGVPAPGKTDKIERMNSEPQKVNYVLEIPAEMADKYGFNEGGRIELD